MRRFWNGVYILSRAITLRKTDFEFLQKLVHKSLDFHICEEFPNTRIKLIPATPTRQTT